MMLVGWQEGHPACKQVCPQSCSKRPMLLGLLGTCPHHALSMQALHAQHACSSSNSPSCRLAVAQWELQIVETPPLVSMTAHICLWNYPFQWTDHQTPLPASGPVWPTMPNSIWIRSPVFPQCTAQTHRWLMGKFNDYRLLLLYRQ